MNILWIMIKGDDVKKAGSISDIIGEIGDAEAWLVVTDSDKYAESIGSILGHLVNTKKMPGIYISLNKPVDTAKKSLGDIIDLNMLIFIDGMTAMAGMKPHKKDGCIYFSSLTNLTDICLTIDQAVNAINTDRKFILFDSLSTLSIYNNEDAVCKFMHYMIEHIRIKGVTGIFMTIGLQRNKDFIKQLSLVCDRTIEIEE